MESAVPAISQLFDERPDDRALLASTLVQVLEMSEPTTFVHGLGATIGFQLAPVREASAAGDWGSLESEKRDIVDQLVRYVGGHPEPPSEAVWALASARAPRARAALEEVIDQWLHRNRDLEESAYQAVVGLVNLASPPITYLRDLADSGQSRPARYASEWLAHSVPAD